MPTALTTATVLEEIKEFEGTGLGFHKAAVPSPWVGTTLSALLKVQALALALLLANSANRANTVHTV